MGPPEHAFFSVGRDGPRQVQDLGRRRDVEVRRPPIGQWIFEDGIEQQGELLWRGGGNESPAHRRAGEI